MKKVLINADFGGFSLNPEVIERYRKLGGKFDNFHDDKPEFRSDPILIKIVEEFGIDKANNFVSSLAIIEIPDDVEFVIHEYDGYETIHEVHRSWSKEE